MSGFRFRSDRRQFVGVHLVRHSDAEDLGSGRLRCVHLRLCLVGVAICLSVCYEKDYLLDAHSGAPCRVRQQLQGVHERRVDVRFSALDLKVAYRRLQTGDGGVGGEVECDGRQGAELDEPDARQIGCNGKCANDADGEILYQIEVTVSAGS